MTEGIASAFVADDRWFSGIFGYSVYRVDCQSAPSALTAGGLLRAHAEHRAHALYYAKVDTVDVQMVRALSSAGFYVVDVNVMLALPNLTMAAPVVASTGIRVCDFQPEFRAGVLNIASTTFEFS